MMPEYIDFRRRFAFHATADNTLSSSFAISRHYYAITGH
jgi:hypothetical protein